MVKRELRGKERGITTSVRASLFEMKFFFLVTVSDGVPMICSIHPKGCSCFNPSVACPLPPPLKEPPAKQTAFLCWPLLDRVRGVRNQSFPRPVWAFSGGGGGRFLPPALSCHPLMFPLFSFKFPVVWKSIYVHLESSELKGEEAACRRGYIIHSAWGKMKMWGPLFKHYEEFQGGKLRTLLSRGLCDCIGHMSMEPALTAWAWGFHLPLCALIRHLDFPPTSPWALAFNGAVPAC